MTDARCEPPPELRGKDGWHWLVLMVNDGPSRPFAQRWHPDRAGSDSEWGASYLSPSAAYLRGYRYLSPVLTPAEVAALRAERDAAWNEVEREREKYKDDMHAALVEVGRWSWRSGLQDAELTTLRAEVEKLRAALKPFAAVAQEVWDAAPEGHPDE